MLKSTYLSSAISYFLVWESVWRFLGISLEQRSNGYFVLVLFVGFCFYFLITGYWPITVLKSLTLPQYRDFKYEKIFFSATCIKLLVTNIALHTSLLDFFSSSSPGCKNEALITQYQFLVIFTLHIYACFNSYFVHLIVTFYSIGWLIL